MIRQETPSVGTKEVLVFAQGSTQRPAEISVERVSALDRAPLLDQRELAVSAIQQSMSSAD